MSLFVTNHSMFSVIGQLVSPVMKDTGRSFPTFHHGFHLRLVELLRYSVLLDAVNLLHYGEWQGQNSDSSYERLNSLI